MDTFKFTKIVIGLMGIWMIVSDVPEIIRWLFTLDIALENDPRKIFFMSFAQIPLAHFMTSVVLGLTLITFRNYIAKLLEPSPSEQINVSARDIKNIALIAFPAWIIIQTFVMMTFFIGGDSSGDIIRGVTGIILLAIACFYLLKHGRK